MASRFPAAASSRRTIIPRRTADVGTQERRTFTGTGARSRPSSGRCATAIAGCVVWLTGLCGVGQIHHRHRTGARVVQPRPPRLRAGRRQHAPRPLLRSGLLAQGPQGEHPPGRRGGQALRRCRDDLHHRVYLALSLGPGRWCAQIVPPGNFIEVYRQRAAGSLRAARPQGPLRQSPRGAKSRISPASPRLTSLRSGPKSSC